MTDATKLPEHINYSETCEGRLCYDTLGCLDVLTVNGWKGPDLVAIGRHMDAQAGRGDAVGDSGMPWPVSQFGPDDTSGEYDIQVRTPHSLIIVSISGDGQLRDARQVSGYSVFRPTAALAQPAAPMVLRDHGPITDAEKRALAAGLNRTAPAKPEPTGARIVIKSVNAAVGNVTSTPVIDDWRDAARTAVNLMPAKVVLLSQADEPTGDPDNLTPADRAAIERGMQQSRDGEVVVRSFAQYANDEGPTGADAVDVAARAMEEITAMAKAYPTDVFPEPDWKLANEALARVGMSTAGISAAAMRHSTGVAAKIANVALRAIGRGEKL